MDPNRENLMKEIMSIDFTAIDLNLYLDTHPNDQKAIMVYNAAVQKSRMLRDKYERLYGPITALSPNYGPSWRWIESPWPWEK
ncbi:MAG: spore coat protein CotJB [Bacillota bacterium]|nr:spore coat protein CotJB [Bacillota bacterium]